jgi:hypothetical protein
MFRIRACTPSVVNEDGWPEAGCELRIGEERFVFVIDLSHWSIADYERQWREGTKRILYGATSTALMSSYGGPAGHRHQMWGAWRDDAHIYVQQHSVVTSETDASFDPAVPYAHIGERIATSETAVPFPEWRVDLVDVYADAMGIRWPLYPFN